MSEAVVGQVADVKPGVSRSDSVPAASGSPELAFQSQQLNPAAKKLQKLVQSRIETDKEAIAAMQYLSESGVMRENSISARRNLRSELERRNLATSSEFLHKFKAIRDELHCLADVVQEISTSCSTMQEEMKRSKENTSALMQKTAELNREARLLSMQQQLTEAFCKRFYLSAEEEQLVKSRDFLTGVQVPQLLGVLKKIKKIHSEAKVLLRSRNERTGLEIVEKMGQFEEQSFEKLYRWTQRECRNLVSESAEISSLLVEALAALSERKTLLNYSMDEFCMVRKGVVSRAFIDALTRGSSSSSANGPSNNSIKPIEMHAHDPVRYIGDMLAWIHQALACERELVEIMLQKTDSSSDEIGHFVAFSSEGVCRPLKVRLDQVIANDPDVVTMFRIRALLKFYNGTFAQKVSATSPLCTAMLENASLFDKLFFSTLSTCLNSFCEQKERPPADLTPCASFEKILALLQQVLHSYSTAFFDPQVKQNDFKALLDIMMSSLMQCVQQSAADATAASHADMSVYMINSLHKAKTVLSIYEFTDAKIEMLTGQIEAHLDTFINEQVVAFLTSTDLMFAYNKQTSATDRTLSDAENERLKKAAHNLDRFLSSPDQFALSQGRLILSATLREAALTRSQSYFAKLYSDLYAFLTENSKVQVSELLRHPDQIRTLLA